ncbi:MAG: hypothetical protein HZY76_17695 [Anaerolineae bacterium]|nr:MAG: hypothetical protein HZY76_17695 [Anaerolineae bacterium]
MISRIRGWVCTCCAAWSKLHSAGFARLRGYIQPNNIHMFHLLQKIGLRHETHLGYGEATVIVFLQPEPVPA